jgi:hypothetical protein
MPPTKKPGLSSLRQTTTAGSTSASASADGGDLDPSIHIPGERDGHEDDGSELSELTEDEVEGLNGRAAGKSAKPPRGGGGVGRRKRGGMIPPQPWDWAIKLKKNTEDDEEDDEEEAVDGDDDGVLPGHVLVGPLERRRAAAMTGPIVEDDDTDPEDDEDDEYSTTRVPPRRSIPVTVRVPLDDDLSDADGDDDDEEADEEEEADMDADMDETFDDSVLELTLPPPPLVRSLLKPNYENGDELDADGENANADEDSDIDTDAEANDEFATPVPPSGTSTSTNIPPVLALATAATLMDVDEGISITALPTPPIVPAGSSITAGSNLNLDMITSLSVEEQDRMLDPDTPPSSSASSPSSSRAVSPLTSPRVDRNAHKPRSSRATQKDKNDIVATPTNTKVPTPIKSASKAQARDEEAEVDVDEDQDHDPEVEAELQPAHRAEALDALALIELKLFQLREKMYAEKMEDLAWEESLIQNGLCFMLFLLKRYMCID